MKPNYITAYTGATEADGLTPYINISFSQFEKEYVEIYLRRRDGTTCSILIPPKELKTMAEDILKDDRISNL